MVRNEKELTICFRHRSRYLAVSNESPPPNEYDERDDIHQNAVLQQPLPSLENEQTPEAGRCDCLSRRLHARSGALRSTHAAVTHGCRNSISRARSCTQRPVLNQGTKAEKKSQITRLLLSSALVLSLFFILSPFRRISICVITNAGDQGHTRLRKPARPQFSSQ